MIEQEDSRQAWEPRSLTLKERWAFVEEWASDTTEKVWGWLKSANAWAHKRPLMLRWSIVLVSVLASMILGLAFKDEVTTSSQLLLFLPAVLVSALYSGIFAGTIAGLLGAVATIHWKLGATGGSLTQGVVGLILYTIACCIVLGLSYAQLGQREQNKQFADVLETRVQERTAQLETANQELSGFCYSISHDLRAPMRNIVGSSRILLLEAGPQLDLESKERLNSLATSANKLATWVDDLLNHARLGHTELKPEWVNLTKMADELCGQLQTEPGVFSTLTTKIQPNLVVTGDRVLIRLALRSLLENACKYAKKDKPLVIEIGERQIRRGSYIYIHDNGIGFDQTYAKKIFEPFQRLHRDNEYPRVRHRLGECQTHRRATRRRDLRRRSSPIRRHLRIPIRYRKHPPTANRMINPINRVV